MSISVEESVETFNKLSLTEKQRIFNNFDSGWWHLTFEVFITCPYFINRAMNELPRSMYHER